MAAKKTPTKSLLDDVRESVTESRSGFPPWHERLSEQDRAEVYAIREAFQRGEIKCKAFTLARVMSAKLAERGVIDMRPQTFSRWLRNQD